MNRIYRFLLLLVFFVLCDGVSHAQRVDEELSFKGEPKESWIISVNDDRIDMTRADEKKNLQTIVLSAFLKNKTEKTLVCGVSILEDGTVISSTLHQIGVREFERESALAAQARLQDLKALVESGKERIATLEAELNRVTYEVRAAAGLSDVDRNYEKAQVLDGNMEAYKEAKQDLQRLAP